MKSCRNAMARISVIIPAKNEADALRSLLPKVRAVLPEAEVIVVDDGSVDASAEVALASGARVIRHPYSLGNGAAVKTGARAAAGDVLVLMDGDGQHDPRDIPRLLALFAHNYDMVVGARCARSHASVPRRVANAIYNRLAGYVTGQRIDDLTSGFRVVRAERFREFLDLYPNRFSYPTTITMALFRAGYSVGYVPIHAGKRSGRSHVRPLSDGAKFLLIIFKIGTLYAPMKLFVPVSAAFFATGVLYYLYAYFTLGRFTNMSSLMFTTSVLVFLIGLVSEQITQLVYIRNRDDSKAAGANGVAPAAISGNVDARSVCERQKGAFGQSVNDRTTEAASSVEV